MSDNDQNLNSGSSGYSKPGARESFQKPSQGSAEQETSAAVVYVPGADGDHKMIPLIDETDDTFQALLEAKDNTGDPETSDDWEDFLNDYEAAWQTLSAAAGVPFVVKTHNAGPDLSSDTPALSRLADEREEERREKEEEKRREKKQREYLNPDEDPYVDESDVTNAGFGLHHDFGQTAGAGLSPAGAAGEAGSGFSPGQTQDRDEKPASSSGGKKAGKIFDSRSIDLIIKNPAMVMMINQPGMRAKVEPTLMRVEAFLDKIEARLADDPQAYDQGVVEITHGITRSDTHFTRGLVVVLKTLAESQPHKYPSINGQGIKFASGRKKAMAARKAMKTQREAAQNQTHTMDTP